ALLEHLGQRRAVRRLLPDRLVVQDHAADVLLAAGRGEEHLAVGAAVLLGGLHLDRVEALLDRPRALVRREDPLAGGDQRLGGRRELVTLVVGHDSSWSRISVSGCPQGPTEYRPPARGAPPRAGPGRFGWAGNGAGAGPEAPPPLGSVGVRRAGAARLLELAAGVLEEVGIRLTRLVVDEVGLVHLVGELAARVLGIGQPVGDHGP